MQYSKDEIERVLISNEEIQKRLDELAAQVNADYAGKDLLMVCILKGRGDFGICRYALPH